MYQANSSPVHNRTLSKTKALVEKILKDEFK